jgi:hypothetical protein
MHLMSTRNLIQCIADLISLATHFVLFEVLGRRTRRAYCRRAHNCYTSLADTSTRVLFTFVHVWKQITVSCYLLIE